MVTIPATHKSMPRIPDSSGILVEMLLKGGRIYYFILLCVLFGFYHNVSGKPYTAVTSTLVNTHNDFPTVVCLSFPYQGML